MLRDAGGLCHFYRCTFRNIFIENYNIDVVFYIQVFRGYVDDPRNTDNAWIETVVVNFHDNNGDIMSRVPLQAGDDAESVRWLAIEGKLELYASHYDFIRKTCLLHDAYFPD